MAGSKQSIMKSMKLSPEVTDVKNQLCCCQDWLNPLIFWYFRHDTIEEVKEA